MRSRWVWKECRPPARFFRVGHRAAQGSEKSSEPPGSERRDSIFIASEDAARLGLADGTAVRLRSAAGEMRGVCRIAAVKTGTLQAYWPEANVLVSSGLDPVSKEPDYNAWVQLEKL